MVTKENQSTARPIKGCGKDFDKEKFNNILCRVCGETHTDGKIDYCPECKAKNQCPKCKAEDSVIADIHPNTQQNESSLPERSSTADTLKQELQQVEDKKKEKYFINICPNCKKQIYGDEEGRCCFCSELLILNSKPLYNTEFEVVKKEELEQAIAEIEKQRQEIMEKIDKFEFNYYDHEISYSGDKGSSFLNYEVEEKERLKQQLNSSQDKGAKNDPHN